MNRVAIVGSRGFRDLDLVGRYVAGLPAATTVVSGGARGVDQTAEQAAAARGLPVVSFPADWQRYGKRAGYLRNRDIVAGCDELVAFWDGRSPGTANSIELAERAGKKVTVIRARFAGKSEISGSWARGPIRRSRSWSAGPATRADRWASRGEQAIANWDRRPTSTLVVVSAPSVAPLLTALDDGDELAAARERRDEQGQDLATLSKPRDR